MRSRIASRLSFLAQWRSSEPVLVFESDDWGMERSPCGDILSEYGTASEWADESTETPQDLDRLYDVLEGFRDAVGRPATWTANFVVANPDADAIRDHDYLEYHDRGIDSDPSLTAAWRDGLARRSFVPQFHGRSHVWTDHWIRDLRDDVPGARDLLGIGVPGLAFLRQHPGYRSEYVDWRSGTCLDGAMLDGWLDEALRLFETAFGFRPLSTIAPAYAFDATTLEGWGRAGLRYVQAAGYRITVSASGAARARAHRTGQRLRGLLALNRTVKFEPARGRPQWNAEAALARILRLWRAGVPAVVDAHRINFTGRHRDEGLGQLRWLLEAVSGYRPICLSTPELGQAVEHHGVFIDQFTQEKRCLGLPRRGSARSVARLLAAPLARLVGAGREKTL